jgi:hypothetical protein
LGHHAPAAVASAALTEQPDQSPHPERRPPVLLADLQAPVPSWVKLLHIRHQARLCRKQAGYPPDFSAPQASGQYHHATLDHTASGFSISSSIFMTLNIKVIRIPA